MLLKQTQISTEQVVALHKGCEVQEQSLSPLHSGYEGCTVEKKTKKNPALHKGCEQL
jgi:hypothetical protein